MSIKSGGETYDSFRVVTETQQAVTFVVAADPGGREIPLAQIDQIWVHEKGSPSTVKIVLGAVIVVGAVLGIMVAVAMSQWE